MVPDWTVWARTDCARLTHLTCLLVLVTLWHQESHPKPLFLVGLLWRNFYSHMIKMQRNNPVCDIYLRINHFAPVGVTTSKVWQLKQATFMHLNASNNGKSVYTLCTKVLQMAKLRANKQTNMQFSTGELAPRRLHLYLQPVKAVGLLPLTRTLPRPCFWNNAPTVCACSGESAWENAGPPPPQPTIEAIWANWG